MIWILNLFIIILFIEVIFSSNFKKKIFKIILYSKLFIKNLKNKELDLDNKNILIKKNIKCLLKLYFVIFLNILAIIFTIFLILKLMHIEYKLLILEFSKIKFILFSITIIYLYIKLRNKIFKNFKYTYFSKVFHRLVLNSNQRLKMLFEIEKKFFLKVNDNFDINCLFITGLPRSGSTILLNSLYQTNFFSSLKYSDMPFVTCPNLWSKINFSKNNILDHERAHKDGIKIDLQSPEAFEEVFWRSQLNSKYKDKIIYEDNYYTEKISKEFKSFIKLIILKDKKRCYLSKNNNNIVRINFLIEKLKKKKILILFRSPLDHCISMLEQHKNFMRLHEEDQFNLEYMNMLSHHEFGKNHKPICLENFKTVNLPNDINYWLDYWILVYQNLLNYVDNKDIIFLSYESLVEYPNKIIQKILKNLNIITSIHKTDIKMIKKKRNGYMQINKNTLSKANNLYEEIKLREIKT